MQQKLNFAESQQINHLKIEMSINSNERLDLVKMLKQIMH